MRNETTIGGAAAEFPATRWTLIQSSRESENARREALDVLLSTYWKPLYFYVRRKGASIESSKDAVQGFFAHLLEHDFLARPDPNRGKFRAYLRTALDNYLANLHEQQSAQKRGGGVRTVPLDFDIAERDFNNVPQSPDAAYDREWALGVMERATNRLQREFSDGVRQGPLNVFTDYFKTGLIPSYEQSAKAHSMSVPQFKSFLHRTRERFRELVRSEVIHTVSDAHSADEEIAELLRALRS
jgi:RNA polymerase sigma-70 factor (ECF subfamily)